MEATFVPHNIHKPTILDDGLYCTETFNATVAAFSLSAAWDLGLLDELNDVKRISIIDFSNRRHMHEPTLRYILLAMASRRIVELDETESVATPGPGFSDAYASRGFFYWLTRGCGDLLRTLPEIARATDRSNYQVRRDAKAVSIACRNIARSFFDQSMHELIDAIQFSAIADLGCGSGDRIVAVCGRQPGTSAVGIDISEEALAVAKATVAEAGLDGQVSLVQDNVLTLAPRQEYADVDLVTCFMMGHDFWPRARCVQTLCRLRATFPNAENLILGDTCRSASLSAGKFPMFTLGFESVHAAMGQYLPTQQEWDSVLSEAGWRCTDSRFVELPASTFIYRLAPG
jgi:SAM-dependent methyltransferase